MADLVIRGRRVVTAEGVRRAARVSAETCPHYLTVTPYAGHMLHGVAYGLIEGTVTRDGAPPADAAWA